MSLDLNSTNIEYKDNKVIIKSIPKNGENLSVFMRPGDEVVFEIEGFDSDELEYVLVGGDIVVSFANEGVLTFPSLGLMGFSNNPPQFNFGANKSISVDNILSKIEEVNELPITSVDASFKVTTSSNEDDEASSGVEVVVLSQSQGSSDRGSQSQDFAQEQAPINSASQSSSISKSTPASDPFNETMPKNDFDGYKQDEDLVPPPDVDMTPDDGGGANPDDNTGPGNVDDAAKPAFYFKATAHQVKYSETLSDDGTPLVLGGGGSLEGYEFDSVTNQFETETIDMSARSEDMIIRSEDSTYFNNDGSTTDYLSRVLRFEPQMPEGFFVNSFSISGLPNGVTILNKDGSEIAGSSISKEQMIFKDELGNTIEVGSPNFINNFKSVEFTIKYEADISEPFDISIKANYKLDSAYLDTSDLAINQSHTNDYTIAIKDITKADDYSYTKEEDSWAEEGFILSKEPNTNTIYDGSGNSTIIGGLSSDIVYLGSGDDSVYLSGGSDIVYSGAGNNFIDGDAYIPEDGSASVAYSDGRDKVSYEEVKSFSIAELKYLSENNFISDKEFELLSGAYQELDANDNPIPNSIDVEMMKYYKGVYVDLEGFTDEDTLWVDTNGNGIVDEDEKINALSKFAQRDGITFETDDDGNVIGHTGDIPTGLGSLQLTGQDKFANIEDIDGSAYNDTIYGNDSKNIIRGLDGSDIIDGRGGGNELYGGRGYDMLYSGSGADYIDGGADTDTVNYQNVKDDSLYSAPAYAPNEIPVASGYTVDGVTVRLDRPDGVDDDFATFTNIYGQEIKDTLVSIEDVIGSNYEDVIFGSSSTNYIEGMGGNDLIFSGGGINFIDGGDGRDKISYNAQDYKNAAGGLESASYISYLNSIDGINITVGNDFAMVRERNGTNQDRLIDLIKNIEDISGSRGNDLIIGRNGIDHTFWGNDGNDDLRGANGDDHLYGGAGNDILRPGRGVDFSDGGEGVDYLHLYWDRLTSRAVQQIRLSNEAGKVGTLQYSIDSGATWHDGYLTPESYKNGSVVEENLSKAINIEGLHGSYGDDHFIGNDEANRFNAHDGDDVIFGMGGDDTFVQHSVYNWGRTNRDVIDGGSGFNTLDYSSAHHGGFILDMRDSALDAQGTTTNGVDTEGFATVNFKAAGQNSRNSNKLEGDSQNVNAFDDKIKNIQSIIGSRHADEIRADDSGMVLDGWHGVDKLYGGAGDDTIIARNTHGEVLDGGGGTDTLELAHNVSFRGRIEVSNFEILELSDYNAYFNLAQWDDNSFEKIVGGDNSRIYMYGTHSDETFDFTDTDFSEFTGSLYVYGYNGDDIYDFTDATLSADMNFYLDASGGSDTLKMGTDQSINMLDNYYNTFEKFEVGAGSTLEVNAHNNGGRRFYAHNKDFDGVSGEIDFIGGSGNDTFNAHLDKFSDMDGKVSIDGGAGDDTFYANYEALLNGKLTIDGGVGSDTVDVRTTKSGETLTLNDPNMFENIERLELDYLRSNSVEMDAKSIQDWMGSDTLVLDIYNNTQGNNITITNTKDGDMTGFEVGQIYDITLDDNSSFEMQVV